MIKNTALGRIEVRTMPLPYDITDLNGTYTYSGRVLLAGKKEDDPKERDWYRISTINDDGTDLQDVFAGEIPQKKTANGVRWMCFPDNKRILLGDYVLECEPDLDHCTSAKLIPLDYPEEILKQPGLFFHWSEIIIAPDNEHMCWTTLLGASGQCYVGRLVRTAERYTLENIRIVSNTVTYKPDPDHEGCVIPEPARGGEVKQFVRGGRAISEAGSGMSITDGILQYLDSEEVVQLTNTPGYEETCMLSPDETLGVSMSPRLSRKTSCAIFGQIPHPYSGAIASLMNTLYMYAVAGVRAYRKGSIGPVLIDVERSVKEGRSYTYEAIDLSDPDGEWVYYSPISWAPDSTKAMWNEGTRYAAGPVKHRLRIAELLDKAPADSVPAVRTPEGDEIPYGAPVGTPVQPIEYPEKIAGKYSGMLVNDFRQSGNRHIASSVYENFSDDGKTFTNGGFTIDAPASMFVGGRTYYEGDMTITGEHKGEMKLKAVFERADAASPASIVFEAGEDGLPLSRGYAEYDGERLDIADMEP